MSDWISAMSLKVRGDQEIPGEGGGEGGDRLPTPVGSGVPRNQSSTTLEVATGISQGDT